MSLDSIGHKVGTAIDSASVVTLTSSPFWYEFLDHNGHVLLLFIGIVIGILRIAIMLRELRSYRRDRRILPSIRRR